MHESFLLFLFVFGAIFGSFASVLIYRIKSGEKGIWGGRSHCTSCNTTLSAKDLVPIFSYIFHLGKCRHCEKKVAMVYPLLEIVMGLAFVGMGYFGIDFGLLSLGNIHELVKLIFLLFLSFCLVTFSFYDILFMEIPESILVVAIVGVFGALTLQSFFPNFSIFRTYEILQNSLFINTLSVIVSGASILGMYVIMTKELEERYDFLILALIGLILIGIREGFSVPFSSVPLLSGVVASYAIFLFFYLQIYVSNGAWLGGGDLRIAILMGGVLGMSYAMFGILITYITGSLVGIGLILHKKLIEKVKGRVNTMIPFGPFLALGIYIGVLFFQYFSVLFYL